MKKFFFTFILSIFLILTSILIILSTVGVETDKFNSLISKKINQTENLNLKITTIRFKIDIKEISLFLETIDSRINYRNVLIPAKNIKVYVDFISLLKSEPQIKKIYLTLNKLDIKELKKISVVFKPSNFTSFINNKIKKGKLDTDIEIYLDKNNVFDNFIARGSISNLKAEIVNNIELNKTSFNFFADKTDVLLQRIVGESGPIKISEGDLKLKLSSEISLETNFKTIIKYNNKFQNYTNLFKDLKHMNDISNLEAELNNSFLIDLDRTYKVKKYNYKNSGKIIKANFDFKESFKSIFLEEQLNQLSLIDADINTNLSLEKNRTNISGQYLFNKGRFLPFKIKSVFKKDFFNLKADLDYDKLIKFDLINYSKPQKSIANFYINLEKHKNYLTFKNINLAEKNNLINIEDLKFNRNKFLAFKKILIKTNKDSKINNDFEILFGKKILIKGTYFDASNLPKILNDKKNSNIFYNINKEIEIDFADIKAPLSENLKNFKLIGKIEKGKFVKISSKGDFGNNNYLDIKMNKDKDNKKKYLEIYSDLPKPLLTEFSFFKGLNGGKLLYTSIIDRDNTTSKLKIENFNVINAPGMVKLLSLADLSGLADLAEGDGLSFDILEIVMEKNQDTLKLNEIIALGPSISVLMDGYQNPTVTSLRGTLVPAKTLNKMISKIPILGNIVIPKEVGEGLFGISFKMKGPPGKIKTSINPIKTITPRFIQKIIDRNKKSK